MGAKDFSLAMTSELHSSSKLGWEGELQGLDSLDGYELYAKEEKRGREHLETCEKKLHWRQLLGGL